MRKIGTARDRFEDGRACIDIKLRTAHQLFDARGAEPYHVRDLDEDAVKYIIGSDQDIPSRNPAEIVSWMARELSAAITEETVVEAVRAQFTY